MTYGHSNAAAVWEDWDTLPQQTVTGTATSHTTEDASPAWLPSVKANLEQLLTYQRGWDSYGSEPISSTIANAAYSLLQQIAAAKTPKPSIVPTSDGSVQIEWHTRGMDVEVRFVTPAKMMVAYEDLVAPARSWDRELSFDVTPLKDVMFDLLSRVK